MKNVKCHTNCVEQNLVNKEGVDEKAVNYSFN